MSVLAVLVLAALQGFAEALPISRSGHAAAARIWLDQSAPAGLDVVVHLGVALALALAARARLASALGEGVRAVARPALFGASPGARDAAALAVGVIVSSLIASLIIPRVELWHDAPMPTGVGLLITALMLSSTLAPRRDRSAVPTEPGALITGALAGLAHGAAIYPGASRVGAAFTMLLWIGVRPSRAIDLSFLITAGALLAVFARAIGGERALGLDLGAITAALLAALVAALLGAAALRALVARRRLGLLIPWLVALGLALLAYARTLS